MESRGPIRLQMRRATMDDATLLFEWVNSPSSLAGKIRTQGAIPWDSHVRWLTDRVARGKALIWIAAVDDGPVGQLRLEPHGVDVEVDIFVTPEHRGRGIALQMIGWAGHQSRLHWPQRTLVARVRNTNASSQRLFSAAGFEQTASGDGELLFRQSPSRPNSYDVVK